MEILNLVVRIYIWGVLVTLLMQLIATIIYCFEWKERSTYQTNMNKVGLSWDPLNLQVHHLPTFKHSALRFWKHRRGEGESGQR